uniref:Uncharacterized protein n=1 Tax=Molossus molossus TaxID=27622 RepID=A0A7J8GL43_MOLMO|nr:hypothetical protein HJG59_011426 [Molossus molossus]
MVTSGDGAPSAEGQQPAPRIMVTSGDGAPSAEGQQPAPRIMVTSGDGAPPAEGQKPAPRIMVTSGDGAPPTERQKSAPRIMVQNNRTLPPNALGSEMEDPAPRSCRRVLRAGVSVTVTHGEESGLRAPRLHLPPRPPRVSLPRPRSLRVLGGRPLPGTDSQP